MTTNQSQLGSNGSGRGAVDFHPRNLPTAETRWASRNMGHAATCFTVDHTGGTVPGVTGNRAS